MGLILWSIMSEKEYLGIWEYIHSNPYKWGKTNITKADASFLAGHTERMRVRLKVPESMALIYGLL